MSFDLFGPRLNGSGEPILRSPYVIRGRQLINERHRCRMDLAEGAEPAPASSKPSSVFAFRVGEIHITCTARRLSKIDEVLRQPTGSRVLRDEKLTVGEHAARWLFFELPPRFVAGTSSPSHLGIVVIQTPGAFYVFLYRPTEPFDENLERILRATVDSFRMLD